MPTITYSHYCIFLLNSVILILFAECLPAARVSYKGFGKGLSNL
jgi:hypothetical protein